MEKKTHTKVSSLHQSIKMKLGYCFTFPVNKGPKLNIILVVTKNIRNP